MIKKYAKYLKETIYSDIDPYGEEEWNDDELSPILQIAKRTGNPYREITVLNCSDEGLTSLDGIEKLINLKYLNCSDNQLTNLYGIEKVPFLRLLVCSNNRLTNLDGLENLIIIKNLICWYNPFSEEYKEYLIEYCKNKRIRLYI